MKDGKADYAEIWQTLSQIDVSPYTENKGGLTYLAWMAAWNLVMQHYPSAEFAFEAFEQPTGPPLDVLTYPDGTCTVVCAVVIGGCSRAMWLPVMDHRHNAIQNPNSKQVSDSKMRCLVKCLAIFGLGEALYSKETAAAAAPSPVKLVLDEPKPKKVPSKKQSPKQEEKLPTQAEDSNVEFMFEQGAPTPEEPSWRKWREDRVERSKNEYILGNTWGWIEEGSYGGQRYQYCIAVAGYEKSAEQTKLRALHCIHSIEMAEHMNRLEFNREQSELPESVNDDVPF